MNKPVELPSGLLGWVVGKDTRGNLLILDENGQGYRATKWAEQVVGLEIKACKPVDFAGSTLEEQAAIAEQLINDEIESVKFTVS